MPLQCQFAMGVLDGCQDLVIDSKIVGGCVGGIRTQCTGLGSNTTPRLSEIFLRQIQAEVVRNSRNKIPQTEQKFSPPKYKASH